MKTKNASHRLDPSKRRNENEEGEDEADSIPNFVPDLGLSPTSLLVFVLRSCHAGLGVADEKVLSWGHGRWVDDVADWLPESGDYCNNC